MDNYEPTHKLSEHSKNVYKFDKYDYIAFL